MFIIMQMDYLSCVYILSIEEKIISEKKEVFSKKSIDF